MKDKIGEVGGQRIQRKNSTKKDGRNTRINGMDVFLGRGRFKKDTIIFLFFKVYFLPLSYMVYCFAKKISEFRYCHFLVILMISVDNE